MKKILSLIILIALNKIAFAQSTEAPATLGFAAKFESTILKEDRKFWVHLPYAVTTSKERAPERYPVIYLLDGDSNFTAVVAITEHLSAEGRMPPAIVIGVLHPNRRKDLTVGLDREDAPDDVLGKDAGGGLEFMAYLEKELMPYVESHYATNHFRVFIGHSLGGLSVMRALVHQSNLFNAYVSLDASVWWNKQSVVREAPALMKTQDYSGKSLYVAMANRLPSGMNLRTVRKDKTDRTSLLRANLDFIDQLKRHTPIGLRYQSKFYPHENHGSLPLIGEYDALRFIFDPYFFNIDEVQLNDPKFDLVSAIEKHYAAASQKMNGEFLPNRALVNQFGYRDLGAKRFARAKQLFELNLKHYPRDANSYDSLGDLYVATGDTAKAIALFQQALSLEPIPETKEKLESLMKK